MGIARAGIISPEWAETLKKMLWADGYVDYYIATDNVDTNVPIEPADAEFIRSTARWLDSITGLMFRETEKLGGADIVFIQVDSQFFDDPADEETLGAAVITSNNSREFFAIAYVDKESQLVENDNITIMHEIGHALGLGHPYGDGYNPSFSMDDTIMSYNYPPSGWAEFTDSDINALKYLWGEDGTGFDFAFGSKATPDPPATTIPSETINDSIGRLYTAAFGRKPDDAGLFYWVNQVNDPLVGYKDVSQGFVDSLEFSAIAAPGASSDVFTTALYLNVLGREPDPSGLWHWTSQLDSGALDRADVLMGFANSPENIALYETLA